MPQYSIYFGEFSLDVKRVQNFLLLLVGYTKFSPDHHFTDKEMSQFYAFFRESLQSKLHERTLTQNEKYELNICCNILGDKEMSQFYAFFRESLQTKLHERTLTQNEKYELNICCNILGDKEMSQFYAFLYFPKNQLPIKELSGT